MILESEDELAQIITLENGKAYQDALFEARYSAEFFRWFSEQAVRIDGSITNAPMAKAKTIV